MPVLGAGIWDPDFPEDVDFGIKLPILELEELFLEGVGLDWPARDSPFSFVPALRPGTGELLAETLGEVLFWDDGDGVLRLATLSGVKLLLVSLFVLSEWANDFFPDLAGNFGLEDPLVAVLLLLAPASVELELLQLEDFVSLPESVSLDNLDPGVVLVLLLVFDAVLEALLFTLLFLSFSLELKNLNLSNIEFLLLEGFAGLPVLLEEDVELVELALVLLDCFSAAVGILGPERLLPPGVGIPEWVVLLGDVARNKAELVLFFELTGVGPAK